MARTSSLLVAIAFAAAPHTAHALGVTDRCDCPAIDVSTFGHALPCGAEGDTYVPPEDPCTFYMCDTGEWVETIIDCFTSCASCEPFCIETGGPFPAPAPGQCCGKCEGGTFPDGRK